MLNRSSPLLAKRRYVGQISNRCFIADTSTGSSNWQAQTHHLAIDSITSIGIAIPNFYHLVTGDVVGSGTTTVSAAVWAPSGDKVQLKFGGQTTTTIAPGGLAWSDLSSIWIPGGQGAGSKFYVRLSILGGGCCYSQNFHVDNAGGDGLIQSATDMTMSGTISSSGGYSVFPLAIYGLTRKVSVVILGDSRQEGQAQTTSDAWNDRGEIVSALGMRVPYVKLSSSGETYGGWLTGGTMRQQLLTRGIFSHVINGYGINAPGTAVADASLMAARGMPRPTYQTTFPPYTTGAWTASNGSDQTASWPVETYNAAIRGGLPCVAGAIEIANFVNNAADRNKWAAPGMTADGIHELNAANALMQMDPRALVLGHNTGLRRF